ncbi:GMC oxidoreductase [Parathielavia appendiculata]|uniref:GMC oxidoreductase n=1 Tax=Parathielavia appendiculata TaxID=2587402 RepID=A0AAN6U9R7_9PEZI|nr:GMC oxidoreductase [Parathielavia appendiculata]
MGFSQVLFCLFAVPRLTGATPFNTGNVKRQASELLDSYDFIIAGGGTSGLTVADRLTEAFPDRNVLVIEYGEVEYAPGVFDPPVISWGTAGGLASGWLLNSTPSPELNNNTALVMAGQVVGGSSAINGMFFDRGSRFDYDSWDRLQGDRTGSREKDTDWSWDGVYPFFKKSVTFTPPPKAVAKKYNYTWDTSTFGNTTPIYASLPPFLWGDHYVSRQSWQEMGIRVARECANGDKEGLCWIPISEHPVTASRSYAGIGHYSEVVGKRPNYHLFVKHQVARVVYPKGNAKEGQPVVEVRPVAGGPSFTISAKKEVVLSAGVFGTPAILQRSGIGPPAFLQSANIPLVLDLPGVGSNLQDHSGPRVQWNCKSLPFYPLPSEMLNETFAAEAAVAFNQTPAQGPYTLAMSNSAIWVPLPNITATYSTIIDSIRRLANATHPASLHLPPSYNSEPTLIAGYRAQLLALADLLANPRSPSLESTFATGTSAGAVLLHPLSRGTVRLNLTSPFDPPVLDYRSASNPIDLSLHLAHTRYLRRMMHTDTFKALGAVEVQPGETVQTDEELEAFVRRSTVQSYMHPCCTAAMMPREKGGVVGPDLRVHGAGRLRVVDMSVLPVLPGAHLSATAYAVGEKAADIIINQWSKRKDG